MSSNIHETYRPTHSHTYIHAQPVSIVFAVTLHFRYFYSFFFGTWKYFHFDGVTHASTEFNKIIILNKFFFSFEIQMSTQAGKIDTNKTEKNGIFL